MDASLINTCLGLPYYTDGKKLPAGFNALTRKIDGNTDSNFDGDINAKDRNGYIEQGELYAEVFNNRSKYEPVIAKLGKAGLEDPFEITPELKEHVANIIGRYGPQGELETAKIILRSVMPSDNSFCIGEDEFFGLKKEEGGLDIPYNKYNHHPLRQKYGNILPKELINARGNERVAQCAEYSELLTVLLRIAGIKAWMVPELGHVYVAASLDGETYRLDAGVGEKEEGERVIFEKTDEDEKKDIRRVIDHYTNEASTRADQGNIEESIKSFDTAIMLDPELPRTFLMKGRMLFEAKRLQDAIDCLEHVTMGSEFDRSDAFSLKGDAYVHLGNMPKAVECYEESIKLSGYGDDSLWSFKAFDLECKGMYKEALFFYDIATKRSTYEWDDHRKKAHLLIRMERLDEALECYDTILKKEKDTFLIIETLSDKASLLRKMGRDKEYDEVNLQRKELEKEYFKDDTDIAP